MLVTLKALGAFPYARRNLRAGQSFEASESDARLLVTIGKARYETRVMAAQTFAAPVMAPVVVPKRRGRPRKNKV